MSMSMSRKHRSIMLTGFLGLSLSACGQASSADAEFGETASVELALNTVPSNVGCIRMILSGSTSRTVDFSGPYPNPSVLDLGSLSPGALTITGTAYNNVACAGVTAATPIGWISDAVSLTARAGLTTNVTVTLRPNLTTKATVGFVIPASAVATAANASYSLMQDGTIRAWGSGALGELGDGGLVRRNAPVTVYGISTAVQIAAGPGGSHACAILANGTASCWGYNYYGQLGNGTTGSTSVPSPVTMPSGVTFTQIAAGSQGSCALGSDKYAYCWGYNGSGQIGDGTTTNRLIPTRVASSTNYVEIKVGDNYVCARTPSGRAECWGFNLVGQHGNNGISTSLVPTATYYNPIVGLTAGSSHTCALSPTGSATCAGSNYNGQIGNDSSNNAFLPAQVLNLTNAAAISAGSSHTCAVRTDGTASCWGAGNTGQMGDGSSGQAYSPRPVYGLTGATSVSCGYGHSCALQSDGSVSCWGENSLGQIGDSTNITRFTPVKVAL